MISLIFIDENQRYIAEINKDEDKFLRLAHLITLSRFFTAQKYLLSLILHLFCLLPIFIYFFGLRILETLTLKLANR